MVYFVQWYASGGQIAYGLSCDSSTTQPVSGTVHFDGVDTVDYEQTITQLLLEAKSASFVDFSTTWQSPIPHPQIPSLTPVHNQPRMWANAQRDGHPAKYRWRPLFNTAKFG